MNHRKTATEMGLAQNIRMMRANSISARIMQAIGQFVHDNDAKRDIFYALQELFHDTGAEIITDEDRREAGLSARGELGWTPQELAAIEASRLAIMMRPLVTTMPLAEANNASDRRD